MVVFQPELSAPPPFPVAKVAVVPPTKLAEPEPKMGLVVPVPVMESGVAESKFHCVIKSAFASPPNITASAAKISNLFIENLQVAMRMFTINVASLNT